MVIDRKTKLLAGLAAVAVVLLCRLFYIQIIDRSYKESACLLYTSPSPRDS